MYIYLGFLDFLWLEFQNLNPELVKSRVSKEQMLPPRVPLRSNIKTKEKKKNKVFGKVFTSYLLFTFMLTTYILLHEH